MDVRMPDGTVITNVPKTITQEDLLEKYQSYQPSAIAATSATNQYEIEPGFFRGIGSLLKSGAESAILSNKISPTVIGGGDVGALAPDIFKELTAEPYRPQALREVTSAFQDIGEQGKKAKGFYGNVESAGRVVAEIGKQLITNPKGVMYMTAEQAANMAPAIIGMMSGAAAGTAIAGPVGSVVGGIGGGFAAQAPGEIGSEFIGNVGKELQARNLPITVENITNLLSDKEFAAKAISESRTKGATTAAVDAAFTLGAGKIAAAPRKAALAAAEKELGEQATAASKIARAQELLKERGFGQKVATGAKATGTEVVGGGASEAAGSLAAYGDVDWGNIGLEMLGELGGSAVEVPAAARSLREKVKGGTEQPLQEDKTTPDLTGQMANLTSPIVSTMKTIVDGKEVVKTTRADDSVDIDGVLVEPPRQETEPAEVFYSEQPLPQEVLDQGYKLVGQQEEDGQLYYAYTKEEPIAEAPVTTAAPQDTAGLNAGDLELLAQVSETQPAQFTDPDTGSTITISRTKLNDPALIAGEAIVYGGKTYYTYANTPSKDAAGQLELAPVNPEGTVLPTPSAAPVVAQLPLAQVNPEGTVLPAPAAKQEIAAPVAKAAPPQAKRVAAEPTARYGITDEGETGVPLTEGAKPFKTRKEAEDVKALQPQLRILPIKSNGQITGYVLADKTQKQLAAEKVAAQRLQAIPVGGLLGDILRQGGINPVHRAELGFDTKENPVIGNRRLFVAEGKGASLADITERQEEGSVAEDEYTGRDINFQQSLPDRIKNEIRQYQSGETEVSGVEALEQKLEAEYQDFLAAEQEAGNATESMLDAGYTQQDLNVVGFTKASPELKAEVAALEAQMEALGLDTSDIIAEIAFTSNITDLEYYTRAKSELTKEIAQAAKQGGGGNVSQANVPSPQEAVGTKEITLYHGTKSDIIAQQLDKTEDLGPHFTVDKNTAQIFAEDNKTSGKVLKAKATFSKILNLPDLAGWFPTDIAKEIDKSNGLKEDKEGQTPLQKEVWAKMGLAQQNYLDNAPENLNENKIRENVLDVMQSAGYKFLRDHLKSKGYDAIKYTNIFEGKPADTYIALDMSKITDATESTASALKTLTSPTEAELKSKQEAIDKAAADKAKADREAAAKNKAEADRKAIAAASEKAAGEFELGKTAEEDLSGQKPIFSKATAPSSAGDRNKVMSVAQSVTAGWANVPDVVVVDNMQSEGIPQEVKDYDQQQAGGTQKTPEGFFYRGKIYLLASQLKDEADIVRVVNHEGLGHYGLRGVFGESLSPILDQLATSRRDLVQERADAYGLDMNDRNDRRQAAEEVLATLAQTRPELGFVKRAVAAIRTWLRDHGFKNLKLTDDQIIRDYIIPARNFIENGKKPVEQQLNDIRYSIPPLAKAPTVPSTGAPRLNITGAPIAGTWTAAPEKTLTPYIYKYQDKQVDLKDVQKEISKTIGKIDDALNAYRKETLYYGRVADQQEQFLNKELKPLLKEMTDKKLTLDEVDKYLLALHAEERNKSIAKRVNGMPDGGSGMKTADAQAYLAGLSPDKAKDLQSISNRVRKIIAGTQNIEVAGGLELQSKIDGWNKAWPNYVPAFRDEVDYVNSGSGMGQGFSTRGSSSKRAVGSDKPVKEIIASLADQRQKAIVRSEKARVGKALYALAIANPNPDYWLAIDPNSKSDIKQTEQMLRDSGFDPGDIAQLIQNMAQEPKTGSIKRVFNPVTKQFDEVVKYEINAQNRYSSNVLAIRVNGEDKFLFFNPSNERAKRMAEAIKNLDAEQLGEVTQTIANVTRFIAALSTQYNPIFGAWNFARDVQGAALNLTTTPLRDKKYAVTSGAFKVMKGIYKEVRSRRAGGQTSGYYSDLYRDFESVGGKTGFINQFSNLNKQGTIVERELKNLKKGKIAGIPTSVGGWLSDYNDTLENAVRLSAYEQGIKIGLSKEESAEIAKNLTVNFNRKGAKTAGLGALYAFFNSAVQGPVRLVETLRGPAGKKIIAGGFLLGAFQAAILAMAGFDEDEPSEFIKQKNFVIPTFDGGYVMVPMPLGFNILPNVGRIISEIAFGDKKSGTRKIGDLMEAVVSSFNPLGGGNMVQMVMPTVLDPIANVIINRDSFGRPISREDRALSPSPGYLRSRESAGVIAKGIAEFLNYVSGGTEFNKGAFSPTGDDINYVVTQYLGGVGREAMRAKEFATSIGKEEPFEPYKVPILGKVYGDINAPASVANKFYLNVKQMAEHENELKGRKGPAISAYIKENPEARLSKMANNLENDISKLNKTKREFIERNAPEDRIRRIEEQKLRMMKQFNEKVKRAQ